MTNLIRKAKSDYWKNGFTKPFNSRTFWRGVKKFKGKSRYSDFATLNNVIVTNSLKKAVSLN